MYCLNIPLTNNILPFVSDIDNYKMAYEKMKKSAWNVHQKQELIYKNGLYTVFGNGDDDEQALLMDIPSPMEATTQCRSILPAYEYKNLAVTNEKELSDGRVCPLEDKVRFLERIDLSQTGVPVISRHRRSCSPDYDHSDQYDYRWPFSDIGNPYSQRYQRLKKKKSKNEIDKYLDGQFIKFRKYGRNTAKNVTSRFPADNSEDFTAPLESVVNSTLDLFTDVGGIYVQRRASAAARLKMRKQLQDEDEDSQQFQKAKVYSTRTGNVSSTNLKRHAAILARMKMRTQNEDNPINDNLYRYAIQNHCLSNFYKSAAESVPNSKRKRVDETKQTETEEGRNDSKCQTINYRRPYNSEHLAVVETNGDQTMNHKKSCNHKLTKIRTEPAKQMKDSQVSDEVGLEKDDVKAEPINQTIKCVDCKVRLERVNIRKNPDIQTMKSQELCWPNFKPEKLTAQIKPIDKLAMKNVQIRLMKSAKVKIVRDVVEEWQRTTESIGRNKPEGIGADDNHRSSKEPTLGKDSSKKLQNKRLKLEPTEQQSTVNTNKSFSKKVIVSLPCCEHYDGHCSFTMHNTEEDNVSVINDKNDAFTIKYLKNSKGFQTSCPLTNVQTNNCSEKTPFCDQSDIIPLLFPYDSQPPRASDDFERRVNNIGNRSVSRLEFCRKRFNKLVEYQARWNTMVNNCKL